MVIDRVHHRHLWSLEALSGGDFLSLLDIAGRLKRGEGASARSLSGKIVAVLTDTPDGLPLSFQQAAAALGARVAHVRPARAQAEDGARAARLLGRLYDAIDCEGLDPATVQEIDREAGVPVFNGLAGEEHPTRVLATLLDLQHRSGRPLSKLRVAYLGNARGASCDALLRAAALTGMELRIGAPLHAWPATERLEQATGAAHQSGAKLLLTESETEARHGADFVLDERDHALAVTPEDRRFTLQAVLLSAMA